MKNLSVSDWLTLLHLRGIGPRKLIPLLHNSQSLAHLFEQLPAGKPSWREQARSTELLDAVEHDLHWLESADHHLITLADDHYPGLLREIADPPIALFVKGNPGLMTLPQLAVVGSRNPTRPGTDHAFQFARHLSENGLTITSGMAMGIDAAAHRGALLGCGSTIAVIGTGPDRIYPASQRDLALQIAEAGAIVSEFPPGTPPVPANFPRRNRVISGLSTGTLVVEATLRSGSLITARLASEQGREVFAIPGSIHSPQSKGCHRIIREGARLVETADDIMQDLSALLGSLLETPEKNLPITSSADTTDALDADYLKLLQSMGWDPVSTDELVRLSGFSPQTVSSMLLLLELQGHVSSASGGYFIRTGTAH